MLQNRERARARERERERERVCVCKGSAAEQFESKFVAISSALSSQLSHYFKPTFTLLRANFHTTSYLQVFCLLRIPLGVVVGGAAQEVSVPPSNTPPPTSAPIPVPPLVRGESRDVEPVIPRDPSRSFVTGFWSLWTAPPLPLPLPPPPPAIPKPKRNFGTSTFWGDEDDAGGGRCGGEEDELGREALPSCDFCGP